MQAGPVERADRNEVRRPEGASHPRTKSAESISRKIFADWRVSELSASSRLLSTRRIHRTRSNVSDRWASHCAAPHIGGKTRDERALHPSSYGLRRQPCRRQRIARSYKRLRLGALVLIRPVPSSRSIASLAATCGAMYRCLSCAWPPPNTRHPALHLVGALSRLSLVLASARV